MILTSNNQFKTRLGNLEQRIGSNTLISGSSVITEDNVDTECFIPFVNNAPSGTPQPLRGDTSLKYNANANILTCPTVSGTLFKTGGTASNTAGFTNSVYLESSVPSLTFSNTGVNAGKYTLGATNGNFGIWDNALSSYPFTINSSSNIGIGTNTPSARLDLKYDSPDTSFSTQIPNGIRIHNTNPTVNAIGALSFSASVAGTAVGAVGIVNAVGGGSGTNLGRLALYTKPTTTSLLTEKMTILGDGNVGIGTSTPSQKLNVVGGLVPLKIEPTTSGTDGVSLTLGYSGIKFNSTAPSYKTFSIQNELNDPNATISLLQNTTSGPKGITIKNDGNVGVGTTTPSQKLHISDGNILMGGTFEGMLMNPGSGAGSLAITRSGNFINNVQQIYPPYTDNVGGTSGGGAQISLLKNEMTFSTYPNPAGVGNAITLTERMRITSTGVGINTTNPVYKLQVEGSGTANEIVGWFNNQGAFSSSIAVRQSSKTAYITNHYGLGTPSYDGQLSNAISFGVSSGTSPIQFYNGNTGVGLRGTAKMTILENGRTGIGTNTPALTLDVAGGSVGNSTGDLTLNVNSVGVGGALKVVGGTGVLSGSAGGTSGQHLVITINGVVYKIKLENA